MELLIQGIISATLKLVMASGSNSMIVKLQDLILIILKVSVLEVILLPLLLMISIMKRKNNLPKVLIYLSTKKKERTVSN